MKKLTKKELLARYHRKNETTLKWQKENREYHLERQRIYSRLYWEKNKEKIKARRKALKEAKKKENK